MNAYDAIIKLCNIKAGLADELEKDLNESLNEDLEQPEKKFDTGDERVLEKDEIAYKNMEEIVNLLNMSNIVSKKDKEIVFYVKDVYLDYGADWLWTTIIVNSKDENDDDFISYQLLTPNQWLEIVNGEKDPKELVNDIVNYEYSGLKFVDIDKSIEGE